MFNKKSFLMYSLTIWLVFLFVFPGSVFSGAGKIPCDTTTEVCFSNPIEENTLQDFMKDLLKLFSEIGSVFVILALVYAGFLLVTARGNETQLATGKKALMWAIIGGAVVLGAWTISVGIANTIGEITGATTTPTP